MLSRLKKLCSVRLLIMGHLNRSHDNARRTAMNGEHGH
jgi:hypothetical protein